MIHEELELENPSFQRRVFGRFLFSEDVLRQSELERCPVDAPSINGSLGK